MVLFRIISRTACGRGDGTTARPLLTQDNQTSLPTSNSLELCCGGTGFEYRPGHPQSQLRLLVKFLSPSRHYSGIVPWLDHDLPNPFQLLFCYRSVQRSLDTDTQDNTTQKHLGRTSIFRVRFEPMTPFLKLSRTIRVTGRLFIYLFMGHEVT
jgi:hypothetical protein